YFTPSFGRPSLTQSSAPTGSAGSTPSAARRSVPASRRCRIYSSEQALKTTVRVRLGLVLLMALASHSAALAQSGPPCPRGSGSGLLTPAALGGGIRDGQGVGAANLGATPADIERLWGAPESCLPQRQGYSYNYFLTEDGGQTGWLVAVVFVEGT